MLAFGSSYLLTFPLPSYIDERVVNVYVDKALDDSGNRANRAATNATELQRMQQSIRHARNHGTEYAYAVTGSLTQIN